MKKNIRAFIYCILAVASVSIAAATIGKVEYKSCPTSVDYVVKTANGSSAGIGLISLKIKLGDDNATTNTFRLIEVDRVSGATNTIITQAFTNSFVYSPNALFFAAGNTLRFSNTVSGADIDFAFEPY